MIVLFLLGLAGLGYTIWDFVAHGDITNPWVLIVMIAAWGLFYILYEMFGGEAPKSTLGKELPTGTSPQDRCARRCSYIIDSTLFAGGMTVLSIAVFFFVSPESSGLLPPFMQGGVGLAVGIAFSFLLLWVVSFGIDYWMTEAACRSYEKKLNRLEDAE